MQLRLVENFLKGNLPTNIIQQLNILFTKENSLGSPILMITLTNPLIENFHENKLADILNFKTKMHLSLRKIKQKSSVHS
jgi:hypothetical protein